MLDLSVLPDPDNIGQSEYRALHELLSDVFHPSNFQSGWLNEAQAREHLADVLENADRWLNEIRARFELPRTCVECGAPSVCLECGRR